MRGLFGSLIILGLLYGGAQGNDRLKQLFASWEKAQCEVRSLVVEFTREENDLVINQRREVRGSIRFLRTPGGDLLASYEESVIDPKSPKPPRISFLLNKRLIYLLKHDEKTAIYCEPVPKEVIDEGYRAISIYLFDLNKIPLIKSKPFKPTDRDVAVCLADFFNPFMVLLDRQYAEEKSHLEVVKQDEHFTYLTVKPKKVERDNWLLGNFKEGRAVFTNRASELIPKDMPRQLWYQNTNGTETTFDIKVWRVNGADGPKAEEFARPEDLPGWKVYPPGSVQEERKRMEKESRP